MSGSAASARAAGALLAGAVLLAGSLASPSQAAPAARSAGASATWCGRSVPRELAYGWPVRPFDRQHPIRGNFGDPRTLSRTRFGQDESATPGSFSFHNGVDISAPPGTRVYPVVSGIVTRARPDELVVRTADARTFQYWHVLSRLRPGARVAARRTVLGTVKAESRHVHLSELDGFVIHNPAERRLTPYADGTAPQVNELVFRSRAGRELEATRLRTPFSIVANAADVPPLPVPGAWFGFPVTPAVVSWRLRTPGGRIVVPWRTVFDVRRTEPPNGRFWDVFAAGSYQNFPVFGRRFYWRAPGHYLFRLTPSPLTARLLRPGRYVVEVRVADVCGNHGGLRETIRVARPAGGLSVR